MHKPTAVIAAIAAVALPIAVTTSSQAADSSTTPTSTTPTSPYLPAPTATPKPTPAPTPVPTPAPPAPALVLTGLRASIDKDLATLTYAQVLASSASLNFAVPTAGTYTVTISFRKPGKTYHSVAKAATSVTKAGTTVAVPLKANTYAPSTPRYIKKVSKVKVHVDYSFEVGNRTVSDTETVSIAKK